MFQYDTSQDGFLEKKDLKRLVEEDNAADLPKDLIKAVKNYRDSDLVGQIDFEDFYVTMCRRQPSLMRELCVKYCRKVVPRRFDHSISVDSSVSRCSIETIHDTAGTINLNPI